MADRELTPAEREGSDWWHSITESERRYWLDRADSDNPADAWRMYAREVIMPMYFMDSD